MHQLILFSRGGLNIDFKTILYIIGVIVILGIAIFFVNYKDNMRWLKIRFRGKVVIGWIVYANNLLYEKGDIEDVLPGFVIFSTDDEDGYNEGFMLDVRDYLRRMTDRKSTNIPKLKPVLRDLMEETWKKNKIHKLPKEITDGADVYLAHVLIDCGHLTKQKLIYDYIRIRVIEDQPELGVDHDRYWMNDGKRPCR